MWRLAIALASCLLGCRPERRACDWDQVDALVERLEAADPREHPDILTAELDRVCALPDFTSRYMTVMNGGTPVGWKSRPGAALLATPTFGRACPDIANLRGYLADPARVDHSPLYDVCDLGRFEVMSREEFFRQPRPTTVPWAFHQWLLEHDASARQARALTRALLVLERRGWWRLLPIKGLRIPRFDMDLRPLPWLAPLVQISPSKMVAFERPIVGLQAGKLSAADVRGHVVNHLYDLLEEEREAQLELVVSADVATPFATLIDVLYTSRRAGYARLGLVIETGAFDYGVLPIDMGPAERWALRVEVSTEGYRLREWDSTSIVEIEPSQLHERALASCKARSNEPAVLAVGNEVELELVIEAIVALRDPACRAGVRIELPREAE